MSFFRVFENVLSKTADRNRYSATAPTVTAGGSSLNENVSSPNTFSLNAVDGGDGIASYVLVTPPLGDINFSFNTATGEYSWHPNGAFEGLPAGQSMFRQFRWKALNNSGQPSRTVTETLTITGVNDAPVANLEVVSMLADEGSISGFFDWSDVDSVGLFATAPFEITSALSSTNLGDAILLETGDQLLLETGDTILQESAGGAANIGTFTLVDSATGEWLYETDGDFDSYPFPEVANLTVSWRVRDSAGDWSSPAELQINVHGVTAAVENFPVMTTINVTTLAGVPVVIDLIDYTTDADGDYSSWVLASDPLDPLGVEKGVATLSSDGTYATGRLTYNPGNDFDDLLAGSSEIISMDVYALDANNNPSNTVSVDIQVNGTAVASPPNAQNISLTVEYNAANVTGQCIGTDPDGDLDESSYAKSADPAEGILDISATGVITFQPNGDFNDLSNGQSRQVVGYYTVQDDLGNTSAPASITVTVVNSVLPGSPPVIQNRNRNCDWQATWIEGSLQPHTLDADGDANFTTYVVTTDVAEGRLSVPPSGSTLGYWRFTPDGDFSDLAPSASRQVYFEATVEDNEGRVSAPGRVTINVIRSSAQVAVPPVAANFSFTVNADATYTGQVTAATDADGDLNPSGYLIASAGDALIDGVITISSTGLINYDPNGVFNGVMMGTSVTRTFTYTASDTGGRVSSPATITVTINGVASMVMEPMYPDASKAAIVASWPFEETAMSRMMALETAFPPHRTAVQSGNWSSAATWGGSVPQAFENVMIPYGTRVIFDEARQAVVTDNTLYGFIHCHGELAMKSTASVRLRCDTIIGHYGAHFSAQPNSGVINEVSFVGVGDIDVANDPAVLSKGMIWMGTITVKGYGAGTVNEKDPYALCSRSAWPAAGNTTVTLQTTPVGWEVGDVLIIPRTEQNSPVNSTPTAEDEEVTITAINGNVITFTPALTYDHDDLALIPATPVFASGMSDGNGGDYPELAICNFTRNIKFTNEAGSSGEIHHRPHIMLMHRVDSALIVFEDAEVNHFGRTNKLVPAFTPRQQSQIGPIVADTNMKGRYSLHLHWVGIDPVDESYNGRASIKRNAFYESPGWHVAVHRSGADVVDNVSWKAFSHYHCGESGDEHVTVRGNIAINCRARRTGTGGTTGQVIGSKRDILVSPHDLGNTGQGFFFQGRIPDCYASTRGWNRVYGSEGDALLWLHRGPFVTSTLDFGLHRPRSAEWEFGEVVGWDNTTGFGVDSPRISRAQHFQVTCCERGIRVVKANPTQNHGLRTFFKDIIITGCRYGIEWEYTQHYTGQRFAIWMSTRLPTNQAAKGFEIFNNTHDITLMYGKIGGAPGATNGGFAEAIATTHTRTSPNTAPVAGGWGYIFDSILFGTQAGGVNNIADMPTYLATRTGPDGVTGTEDQAFNMTFRNPATGVVETFGAPPLPYSTFTNTMALCAVGTSRNPTPLTQWTITQPANHVGTVTDAYGVARNPLYYGTSGTYVNNVGGTDVYRRYREEVGSLLLRDGYWQEAGTGKYFVEDVIGISPRTFDSQTLVPYRLYLNPTTPGIAGNAGGPNLGGGATFTFNGTKA